VIRGTLVPPELARPRNTTATTSSNEQPWAADEQKFADELFEPDLAEELGLRWNGIVQRGTETGIARQVTADAAQRKGLRDAFALAHALGRILILPPVWCFCDRYWWLLHKCRMPGAEAMPLPFNCPADYLFEVSRFHGLGLSFREARFLSHERLGRSLRETDSRMRLRLVAESAAGARAETSSAVEEAMLPAHIPYEAARDALVGTRAAHVPLLEVNAADLDRFCGFADQVLNRRWDDMMRNALGVHLGFCASEDNFKLPQNWDPEVLPLNCTIVEYEVPSLTQRSQECAAQNS